MNYIQRSIILLTLQIQDTSEEMARLLESFTPNTEQIKSIRTTEQSN